MTMRPKKPNSTRQMAILHKILFVLFFPLLTVWVSAACWLTAGIGKNARVAHWCQCQWARLGLRISGVRIKVDISRLDPSVPYVFLANHQSQFDIPLILAALGKHWNVRFVAKEALFRIPLFGPAMVRTGHISILRENSRKAMKSIDDAVAAAERGISVLIFPEGTRSDTAEHLGDFKIGGMIMALKCNRPVVPVIMTGSYEVLPRGSWIPNPGVVHIEALAPFDPTERYTLKQREDFRLWLKELMETAYQERRSCRTM